MVQVCAMKGPNELYSAIAECLLETGSPDHVGICAHVQKQRLCMGKINI